jgi:hypothetical protein
VVDIFLALGVFVVVMRMNREPKDDPRLSRGLQLLQSKIAVLEDLSDRTEVQVNQLTAILEQKAREVQAKVQLAEQHVHEIRVAMDRSLEVAKIFQDKIPHQEIIERQSTIKYVHAARLAHQGLGVDEIAAQVDLPKGEIEFIAKVNREQLMFNEEQLPWWAKENAEQSEFVEGSVGAFQQASTSETLAAGSGTAHTAPQSEVIAMDEASRLRAEMELAEQRRLVENLSRLQFEMQNLDIQLAANGANRDLAAAFEVPKVSTESLQKLGEEFRRACDEATQVRKPMGSSLFPPLEQLTSLIPETILGGATDANSQTSTVASTGAASAMGLATTSAPASAQASALTNGQSQAPGEVAPTSAALSGHEKLKAALRATAQPAQSSQAVSQGQSAQPGQSAQGRTEVSQELAAARAMAKEVAASVEPHHVISRRANGEMPIVKRVAFPRIDSDV